MIDRARPMPGGLPVTVLALLAANAVVFLVQSTLGDIALLDLMLWPLGDHRLGLWQGRMLSAGFEPWQLLTYGFLHGDIGHIAFNMVALASFGGRLERLWGPRRFLVYYLVCVIGAGLVQLVVATLAVRDGGQAYRTIGASGGVFGILLAFGMLFPHGRIQLAMPPITLKARTLVILYGVGELLMGVFYRGSGIAHFAHLGGMLFGFALLMLRGRGGPRALRP